MFANNSTKIFLLFLLMSLLMDIAKTTRCGKYICDEKSTCVYNQTKSELDCICDEGFIKNIKDKFINCYQPEMGNVAVDCLNVDEKCGPNHKCNENLICQEINGDNIFDLNHAVYESSVCNVTQEKCGDKCCVENEMCQGGECIAKEFFNIFNESIAFRCAEFKKCQDKCCADDEICKNDKECVLKLNEKTQEICNESGSKCVVKSSAILKCSQSLQCNDKCCSEQEICKNDDECIAKESNDSQCPSLQKCLDKCCTLALICNADNECVDAAKESSIIFPIAVNFDCPASQRCLNRCCSEHEKCNEKYECVLNATFECPDTTEKCGNKCCPINETCNEDNECVAFLELTTIENYSQKLNCPDIPCMPLQVCNEFNECVNKSFKDATNLYDSPNEITTSTNKLKTINDYDTIISIYDFDDIKKNYYICPQNCCHKQQICNKMGMCEEKVNETNCTSSPNCLENANIKDIKTSAGYTIIGLGCLILVTAFGLFKLYNFRRLPRILF